MRPTCHRRNGLTLLELLVVVFILAAVAGAAVTLTDTIDQQSRYDDTISRLTAIRYGIVGDPRPNGDGRRLLSGFVVDTGRTPATLLELTNNTWTTLTPSLAYGRLTDVVFDATPDSSTALTNNSGDELHVYSSDYPSDLYTADAQHVQSDQLPLFKGVRGPYVRSANGSTTYRDGWGNVATDGTDAFNSGWAWTSATVSNGFALSLLSLGSDNIVTPVGSTVGDTYVSDVTTTISANEWSVPSLQVDVLNTTTATPNLSAIVSVYTVSADGSTASFRQIAAPAQTITAGSTTTSSTTSLIVTPPSGGIPIGRHAVALYDSSGSSFAITTTSSPAKYFKTVDVYPMVSSPTVTFLLQ